MKIIETSNEWRQTMKEALSDEAPGIGLASLTLSDLASKTLSTT